MSQSAIRVTRRPAVHSADVLRRASALPRRVALTRPRRYDIALSETLLPGRAWPSCVAITVAERQLRGSEALNSEGKGYYVITGRAPFGEPVHTIWRVQEARQSVALAVATQSCVPNGSARYVRPGPGEVYEAA